MNYIEIIHYCETFYCLNLPQIVVAGQVELQYEGNVNTVSGIG